MKLHKLIVEIRYNEPPELFRFRDKLIANITEDKNIKLPPISEGLQFTIKRKWTKVIIETNRLGADIILPSSIPNPIQFSEENILKIFKLINTSLNIQNIERIGVRSLWIHAVDRNMKELVAEFKKYFFTENELVNSAKDIAVVLTLTNRDRLINYNLGPMAEDQLSGLIKQNISIIDSEYEEEGPKTAIYLDYDYYLNKRSDYSDAFFRDFIREAMNNAIESAKNTLQTMEVMINNSPRFGANYG